MNQRIASVSGACADRRSRRRDQVEMLLELAQHVAPADRLLLEQVYRHGLTAHQIACLSGRDAGAVRRRIRRVIRQIRDPMFAFVVGHDQVLEDPIKRVAASVVLRGCTFRQAADESGLPLHEVRQHMAALRAIARHFGVPS